MRFYLLAPLLLCLQVTCRQWTCTVESGNSSLVDDAPAIVAAFAECNLHKGKVILTNTTYYINSVMNITGLKSVDLDILGTMIVSSPLTLQEFKCR
jgi:galacturan 1,4-alpha-galacturonidase